MLAKHSGLLWSASRGPAAVACSDAGWMLRAGSPISGGSLLRCRPCLSRLGCPEAREQPHNGSTMQNSFDITTLIFLALAVFVIWRLRSVLGQKTGSEQPPFDPISRREPPRPGAPAADGDNVVRLPGVNGSDRAGTMTVPPADRWKGIAEPGSRIAQGLDEILRAEPQFDGRGFVDGSKAAYEMIVTAFANGDRKILKDLLSRDVYDGFERAIVERERRGEKVETTFVSIDRADIDR